LAKDESASARLDAVLYTAADALRALAVLLSPFMPEATEKLWRALGANDSVGPLTQQLIPQQGTSGVLPVGSTLGELEPLFPRVEQEE
jgi:methionyl-tRNA synthetase